MTWTSLALEFCGLALLSLSMERHYEQVFGSNPAKNRTAVLCVAGWLLLALATWPPIVQYGVSIGLAVWTGSLTIAAVATLLLHTYAPSLLPRVIGAMAISVPMVALVAR